jgi:hypothetical protein
MSIKEVDSAIRNLSINDEHMQTPEWCRYATEEMIKVAEKADVTPPHAKIEILVYPKASAAEKIHYAVRASSPEGDEVFNPNPAPLFPQYIGSFNQAPGLISRMIVAQKIL